MELNDVVIAWTREVRREVIRSTTVYICGSKKNEKNDMIL